ncbi:SH2B adapter protein 1-like [Bacillus rossius redtenbacheri]|uniref:SH2B adapter protein 1-like n=1 Tax=Bacillus rossius redtenbacheri TaxID=93214 RepID=UPI002FDD358C
MLTHRYLTPPHGQPPRVYQYLVNLLASYHIVDIKYTHGPGFQEFLSVHVVPGASCLQNLLRAAKPKSGVFCFLITEARETTALEMPDHENTFVLKAENNMEYVIEAHDTDDMRSWLATIKYCMRTNINFSDSPDGSRSLLASGVSDGDRARLGAGMKLASGSFDGNGESAGAEHPPELPPRVHASRCATETSGLRHSSNSSFELCSTQSQFFGDGENLSEPELDLWSTLRDYPWFHGTLPRSEAAHLVLNDGLGGHGIFLVRQSETRKGEFVLTFNFQGRAKHLRMTLNDQGQCRVQHLWFPTIFDMLEHFRQHPIPLESGGTADVTLTEFVVALSVHRGLGSRSLPVNASASEGRRLPAPPEPREVVTHAGTIRTRTESMERIQERQSGSGGSTSAGRAVENTYSFV